MHVTLLRSMKVPHSVQYVKCDSETEQKVVIQLQGLRVI